MKKILALVLTATMMLSLAACGGGAQAPAAAPAAPAPAPAAEAPAAEAPAQAEAPAAAEGPLTLGFVLGCRTHAFYLMVEEGILAGADHFGFDAIVLESGLSGAVASERIQQLVVEGVDAVSLAINEPAATNVAIEAAHAEGMPMFGFDARTDLTDVIISFVGTDNVEGGRVGGRATINTLRELGQTDGAVVGIIAYPEPQSTIDRETGWMEIMEQYREQYNLTIVNLGNYRGQADIAHSQMADALVLHPDMAVVFTVGSPASIGALAAIKAAGANTQIIGFDANPEAHAAILDPVDGQFWIADVAQDPFGIGFGIAEQKHLYLTQGRVDAAEILIAPFLVDSSNAVMPG